ncbi:hypothetical protein AB0I66_06500 [Streptomyces sp. NPDC050439]|uniref:hypothetical protein n=1 Tax=unclassified Streptomyces TaxID=2593676 RepID=UPI0034494227
MYVRTAPGSVLTAAGLREGAGGAMATYKVSAVEILDGLPLTATGKFRKTEPAERAAATAGPARQGDPTPPAP